mmetsp:Transcript_34610/g.109320  ORF Transcript_34610/g.109320 Transcript_34610/m.109320 type:complete len:222 (-) Transcript_34610:178-843(-)
MGQELRRVRRTARREAADMVPFVRVLGDAQLQAGVVEEVAALLVVYLHVPALDEEVKAARARVAPPCRHLLPYAGSLGVKRLEQPLRHVVYQPLAARARHRAPLDGVRLARAGGAECHHRRVVSVHHAADERLHGALEDVLLRGLGAVAELHVVLIVDRGVDRARRDEGDPVLRDEHVFLTCPRLDTDDRLNGDPLHEGTPAAALLPLARHLGSERARQSS